MAFGIAKGSIMYLKTTAFRTHATVYDVHTRGAKTLAWLLLTLLIKHVPLGHTIRPVPLDQPGGLYAL
jgi:hypothetical protein